MTKARSDEHDIREEQEMDEDIAKHRHEADLCYLQGVIVFFLVVSAMLVLYTTLSDPLTDQSIKLKVPAMQQQQIIYAIQEEQPVRIEGLEVVQIHPVLVQAGDDLTRNTLQHLKMAAPTLNDLAQDAQRKDFAASPPPILVDMNSFAVQRQPVRRRTLAREATGNAQNRSRLADQLFVVAGYTVAVIFFGVILVKLTLDGGDWLGDSRQCTVSWWQQQRQGECSHGTLPESQRLLNNDSFGSTDPVASDWSGDFFDKYDV
ncbi:hypothetical protein MPSEU_000201400 [Mayamaea pseudoterrestris]|nr:hypothetical protein MPSEU_000201400 [Mayamaea pseudoterrestris]